MSFESTLSKFKETMTVFFTKYTEESIVSPSYQTNFLESLNNAFIIFQTEADSLLQEYNSQLHKFREFLIKNEQNYAAKIAKRKTVFLQQLQENTKETAKVIAILKEGNEKNIRTLDKQINILNKDLRINSSSHEQKIAILEAEKKATIEQYIYQNQISKQNYTNYICKSNDLLESKNEILHSSTSKRTFRFDQENKALLDTLQKKVLEIEEKYRLAEKRFESEELVYRDVIISQTIKLNEKINVINASKNKALMEVKQVFEAEMKSLNEKRVDIRTTYGQKNKAILAKFAEDLTKIDKLTEELYHKHQTEKDQLRRKFYYDTFTFDKDSYAVITEIKEKLKAIDKKTNPLDYRTLKRTLKLKIYQNEKLKKQMLAKQTKELADLEYLFIKENEGYKNQKFIAEIEKKYDIANLMMEEKNAHDRINGLEEIAEHDYNTNISASNKKFYIRANELRANNEIRKKIYQKDLAKVEYRNRIKLEDIIREKNSLLNDIHFRNELSHLIHSTETNLYEKEKSLNEVLSLLEIEKNKILYQYNNSRYAFCVDMTNIKNKFTIDRISLETTSANDRIQLERKRLRQQKTESTTTCGLEILTEQNNEKDKRARLVKTYVYHMNQIKFQFHSRRFRLEKVLIKSIHKTFLDMIASFNTFISPFLKQILEFTTTTYCPISNLIPFITDFTSTVSALECELITDYNLMLQTLFEERIAFETGFKYKNQFNDLEELYQEKKDKIIAKRESFENTLENYSFTMKTIDAKIWTLTNEHTVLEKELQKLKVNSSQRKDLNAKLTKLKIQLKEFYRKNDVSMRLKELMEKDLAKIPRQLQEVTNQYEKEYDDLDKEKHNESLVYYRSIKKISTTSLKHQNIINMTMDSPIVMNIHSYKSFFKFLNHFLSMLSSVKESLDSDLQDVLKFIFKEIGKVQLKNEFNIELKHKNHIKEINQQKYTIDIETHNARVQARIKQEEFMKQHILDLKLLEKNYKTDNRHLNLLHRTHLNDLEYRKKTELKQFKINLYAMNDNLNSLEKNERTNLQRYLFSYNVNRNKLTKENDLQKRNIDDKFKSFVQKTEAQILNLPIITKMESRQIDTATKEQNAKLKHIISEEFQNQKALTKLKYKELNAQYAILTKNILANKVELKNRIYAIEKKYKVRVNTAYKQYLKQAKQ